MGAFHGGLTYRQYRVKESLATKWQTKVLAGLLNNIAHEIKPSDEELKSIGWCSAEFPLDTNLTLEQCLYRDEYLVFAMRVDAINIPKGLLNIYCEAEERRIKKEQKKEALNRYEKAEVREQVEQALRKKVLPSIRSTEVVWNWPEGIVRFFSTNKGLNEEFMELFEESFTLTLIPEYAYTLAQDPDLGLSKKELKQLDLIDATPFVDPETLFDTMKA